MKVLRTRSVRMETLNREYMHDPAFQHLRYLTQFVPGRGTLTPHVMLLGSVPNPEESVSGLPGTGRVGAVIREMLDSADIRPGSSYLTMFLKYRPHGGREPRVSEIEAARRYVYDEITILQPSVIVSLGLFPSRILFDRPFGEIQGTVIRERGFAYVPTFSPNTIFGNPRVRPSLIADMQTVASLL